MWTDLDAPINFPVVQRLLGPLPAADLRDHQKLQDYLLHATWLQRCLDVVFLDPEFRRKELGQDRIQGWLLASEKNPRALLALCRPWAVTRTQEGTTIGCNVMTGLGGVEHWTFHLRVDGAQAQLAGIDVQPLRENGTFFSQKGNSIGLLHV